MSGALVIHGLAVRYGNVQAVRGLSFEVAASGGVAELYRDPAKDLYR